MSSVQFSRSVMSDSLQAHGLQPTRLLCPLNSPGKITEVDCHYFLQRIFLTQGSSLGLLHCRQILFSLSQTGSPSSCVSWYTDNKWCGKKYFGRQAAICEESATGKRFAVFLNKDDCFPLEEQVLVPTHEVKGSVQSAVLSFSGLSTQSLYHRFQVLLFSYEDID